MKLKHFWAIPVSLIISLTPAFAQTPAKSESLVVAGGCFWGIEAVFEHTKGVIEAVSGYAGGDAKDAKYRIVSSGKTGHAEAVKITYNPDQISRDDLLNIFFKVAHDPTQLNYQGPDHGPQYRSALFYSTPEQKADFEKKITRLKTSSDVKSPIVTTLEPLTVFYPAEIEHQDFARLNPYNPYIMLHDAPKVKNLEKTFPLLFKSE